MTDFTKILERRDTAANWTANNPTLFGGQIGYEKDTGKFKVGDGATAWTALPYFGGLAAKTAQIALPMPGTFSGLTPVWDDIGVTISSGGDLLLPLAKLYVVRAVWDVINTGDPTFTGTTFVDVGAPASGKLYELDMQYATSVVLDGTAIEQISHYDELLNATPSTSSWTLGNGRSLLSVVAGGAEFSSIGGFAGYGDAGLVVSGVGLAVSVLDPTYVADTVGHNLHDTMTFTLVALS